MQSFNSNLNFGLIGCGLIGVKRALSLNNMGLKLSRAFDINFKASEEVARITGCKISAKPAEIFEDPNIDAVIVATRHDSLGKFTMQGITNNKHVFVEKPGAMSLLDLDKVIDAADKSQRIVRVGYNHRYHPAFVKARSLVDQGAVGDLMFVRARYGHGGRIGYESEWRSNKKISGGGELIDQGSHLIDLARSLLGNFVKVSGVVRTFFWDTDVDDNCFMTLGTINNKVAFLHASSTEWKNTFSMEIYGKSGKLEIEGLGGSYGVEKLKFYSMRMEMGPPDTTIWEFPRGDESWQIEIKEFMEDILNNRVPDPGLRDAREVLRIVAHLYEENGYD